MLKMLQAENFQALTARLCMCELHLKFKGRMIELETVVARIAAWVLLATDGLLITGHHLPHVLKVAVTFLTHKFKTHLIKSDGGEEADHVGCATHCTTYMLSVAANGDANPPGDGPFCLSCAHEHGMFCDECNLPSRCWMSASSMCRCAATMMRCATLQCRIHYRLAECCDVVKCKVADRAVLSCCARSM